MEEAQRQIAKLSVSRLDQLREVLLARRQAAQTERTVSIANIIADHADQMKAVEQSHTLSLKALEKEHAARFRTGLFGLLDKLSGRRKRIAEENRIEHERVGHQHKKERTQLRQTLDRKRSSLEQMTDADLRSEKTLSAIVADIEALRDWRVAARPHAHQGRKRNRNRPARE